MVKNDCVVINLKNNDGQMWIGTILVFVIIILVIAGIFFLLKNIPGQGEDIIPSSPAPSPPAEPPPGNPVQLPLVSITTANNTVITPGEPIPQTNTTPIIVQNMSNTSINSSGTLLNLTNITRAG